MLLSLTLLTSAMTGLMMWLLGSKRRAGWAVSFLNQFNWAAVIYLTEAWGLIPLNLMMLYLAVRGWFKWQRA